MSGSANTVVGGAALLNGAIYVALLAPSYNYASVVTAKLEDDGTLGSWSTVVSPFIGDDGGAPYFESGFIPAGLATMAAASGYLYIMVTNAYSDALTLFWAQPTPEGSIAAWATSTNVPGDAKLGDSLNSSLNSFNGSLYVNTPLAYSATFSYAQVDTTGAPGTWESTTPPPSDGTSSGGTAFTGRLFQGGGYLYALGFGSISWIGYSQPTPAGATPSWSEQTPALGNVATLCPASGGFVYAEVQDLSIHGSSVLFTLADADGGLGTWQPTSPLPSGIATQFMFATDQYLYALGAETSGSLPWLNTVYYAKRL